LSYPHYGAQRARAEVTAIQHAISGEITFIPYCVVYIYDKIDQIVLYHLQYCTLKKHIQNFKGLSPIANPTAGKDVAECVVRFELGTIRRRYILCQLR
jgi:hypothetical protein